jgi:hypothetical protein
MQRLSRADVERLGREGGEASFWVLVRAAFFTLLERMRHREGLTVTLVIIIDAPKNMVIATVPDDYEPPDETPGAEQIRPPGQ